MTLNELLRKIDKNSFGGIHVVGTDSMGDEFYGMTFHAGDKLPKDLKNEVIVAINIDEDIDVRIYCDH